MYYSNIRNIKLLTWCFFMSMNQVSAQSAQPRADQHHSISQQASEGVVFAQHSYNGSQYGSAGLTSEGGVRPDERTIFEIGSITKVFTSILLAEAVRENRANFDDVVASHLPELKFRKGSPFNSITLSELATHTSGLPRLPVDLSEGVERGNPYAHYNEQRLAKGLVSFRKNQLRNTGEYSYSNYGAGILGYVLTQIYDQTYRNLLKEKILDPLGMHSTEVPTRFTELSEEILSRLATPHSAGKAVNHWELGALVGAGAMISSAEDLMRFGKAHWDDEIPKGLASSLMEVAKPRMSYQGLGWSIEGDILSHGGGTGGFRTNLEVDPKNKTVHIFLSNSATVSGEVRTDGDFLSMQGYWSGVLNTEKKKLRLVSYISETGRMVLYSIDQGYQPLLSAKSTLVNEQFEFSLPVIEGLYSGKFENDELNGILVQGGRRGRPLTMKYSKDIPEILHSGLDESLQGDLEMLKGYWSGYLGGKDGLFIYMKNVNIGELSILELYSPDQHDQAIAISTASLKNDKFEMTVDQVNGSFTGKLASDRKSIKGKWSQGDTTRLTLHYSADKPVRE